MQPQEMDRLIEEHLAAEFSANPAGAVAVYTDDVVHDVVGWPQGPMRGKDAAQRFYEQLVTEIHSESMEPLQTYYGPDFAIVEHLWTGTVPGSFLGIAGYGRRISFWMLHIWDFRDGRISRENVWLDGGAIMAQLDA